MLLMCSSAVVEQEQTLGRSVLGRTLTIFTYRNIEFFFLETGSKVKVIFTNKEL